MRKWITPQTAAKVAGAGLAVSFIFHIASSFGFNVMDHPALNLPLIIGIFLFWIPMIVRQEKGLESRTDFLKIRLRKAPLQVKFGLYSLWLYITTTDIAFLYKAGTFSNLPKGTSHMSSSAESHYFSSGFMAFYSLIVIYFAYFPQNDDKQRTNNS